MEGRALRTTALVVSLLVVVSVLAVTALASDDVAGQADIYVIEQGENCTELQPLSYQGQSIEEFYGYPDEPTDPGPNLAYSANTPIDLEERNDGNSSLFLYQGPQELSLVVIHGAPRGDLGGAATFEFSGLPEDGEWAVQDDPENRSVEWWNRTGSGWKVDWGWRDTFTDGGAFAGLSDGFEVVINPAFNEAADLDPVTPGNVTEWRALSATGGSFETVELELDEPVTVRSGTCP